jgi:tRNA (uracil-5-)-methyltransferase
MSGESALTSVTREEPKFIHRVKIVNLPSREMGTVKKLLQTYDLHKFKKAPKWDYAYMSFEVKNIIYTFTVKSYL